MAQNRRQGHEDRQIGRGLTSHAPERERHSEGWQKTLEHVEREDKKKVAEAKLPAHVCGTDVSRPHSPDVGSPDPVVNQVAKGNRPYKVSRKATEHVLDPRIQSPAHWSRPILSMVLSGPPRNDARRFSKISLAVA